MKFIYLLMVVFLSSSCFNKTLHHYDTLLHYDLNKPQIYKMPSSLKEISGLAFYRGNPDTIYTEQDESGSVYLIRSGEDKITDQVTFAKNGDFEDIAILKDLVVMLRSDGVLFSFPIREVWNRNIKSYKEWKKILPHGEYESLYADNNSDQLYLVCKGCKQDNGKNHISGFKFHLSQDNKLKASGTFEIKTKDILDSVLERKDRFKASALTFNSQTQEWYLLSNVNKSLVVMDANWNLKRVINLNPDLYIQPEGIAFDNKMNLYITNEGGVLKQGTIYKFEYNPTQG